MRLVLTLALSGVTSFAGAEPMVRERSPAAAREVARFRASGVDHGGDVYSRVRARGSLTFLEQLTTASADAVRYGVDVAGRSPQLPIASVRAAGPSRHFPEAAYPSITPWVSIRRASAVDAPPRDGAQAWRRVRALREDEQILAVGLRHVVHHDRSVTLEPMRVQRYFAASVMGRRVSVTLGPADDDGWFRELRVWRQGVVGTFRMTGLMSGEIVGFRATPDALFVTTSARVTHRVASHVADDRLTFELTNAVADAGGWLKVWSAPRSARPVCTRNFDDDAT